MAISQEAYQGLEDIVGAENVSKDPAVLDSLGALCRMGLGEVELHLHHSHDTAEGLREKLERRKAAEMANACVEKLKQDPNNVSARERLARLFAEQLDRADQGIEQLGLLLGMPDQPEARRAEWLGLTAAWHLKYRRDSEAAREILERLVREFSQTPQALAAQRRIRLMNEERYRR